MNKNKIKLPKMRFGGNPPIGNWLEIYNKLKQGIENPGSMPGDSYVPIPNPEEDTRSNSQWRKETGNDIKEHLGMDLTKEPLTTSTSSNPAKTFGDKVKTGLGNNPSIIGNVAMGAGNFILGSSIESLIQDKLNNQNTPFRLGTQSTSPIMAYGGNVNQQVPVEVEGGEVVQLPNGQVQNFEGPSHEQGGIETELPENSLVYSKRLKVEGKSLASRKKDREAKIEKLERMIKKNPSDKSLQNSYERMMMQIETEDAQDSMLQEQAAQIYKSPQDMQQDKMKYGGGVRKKYDGGGPVGEYKGQYMTWTPEYEDLLQSRQYGFDNLEGLKAYVTQNQSKYPKFNEKYLNTNTKFGKDKILGDTTKAAFDYQQQRLQDVMNSKNIIPITDDQPTKSNLPYVSDSSIMQPNNKQIQLDPNYRQPYIEPNVNPEIKSTYNQKSINDTSNQKTPYDFTLGDKLGFTGLTTGTLGPLGLTIAERLGDRGNPNMFTNYGKKSLGDIDKSISMTQGYQDQALLRNKLNENSLRYANQNNARSINTIRGLNTMTNQQLNDSNLKLNEVYNRQLSDQMMQRATMNEKIDNVVMNAENQRDLSNRQDRDNFYTKLAQNATNLGTGFMHAGKALNQKQSDVDFLNILGQTNAYGLTYYRDPKTGELKMITKEELEKIKSKKK